MIAMIKTAKLSGRFRTGHLFNNGGGSRRAGVLQRREKNSSGMIQTHITPMPPLHHHRRRHTAMMVVLTTFLPGRESELLKRYKFVWRVENEEARGRL